MIYIFTLLSLLFLPILSLQQNKPKFCINCKYFIKHSNHDTFAKCSFFPREDNDIYMLVNGIQKDKDIKYHYCSIARNYDNMCGPEGKMYKRKYIKKHIK